MVNILNRRRVVGEQRAVDQLGQRAAQLLVGFVNAHGLIAAFARKSGGGV